MYDPMVVDAFFKVHAQAPLEIPTQGPRPDVLNTIARARREARSDSSRMSAEPKVRVDELVMMYELARTLAAEVGLGDVGRVIAKHLLSLIPATLCVFFVYDASCDELVAQHVVGEGEPLIRGARIRLGQRLSGWVAANRQIICNSDAILDLGDVATSLATPLRTSLSAPLVFDNSLIGVLSLYSSERSGFNEDQRRIIEMNATQIAKVFKSASAFEIAGQRHQSPAYAN